ncbi:MAG: ribonuclease R [Hyphomonadaceae bacterium]|nr:ribonuclease R [Hyphomonadaceae bacterium]
MSKRPKKFEALSKERVLAALEKVGGAARKRELARELDLPVEQKSELRRMLKELEADGALGRSGRRTFQSANALPSTGVMDIIDRDGDGELIGRMRGDAGLYGPNVRLAPGEARGRRGEGAIGIGDRVLARIEKDEDGPIARVIKRLGQSAHRILGVFHGDARGGGRIEPADRKARYDLMVLPEHQGEARDGDLVLAELATGPRAYGPKRGLIKEVVGREDDPRAASILAIHTHGIPIGFSEEEEREARAARAPVLGQRTDLRQLPLITIDPEDARDHDDAVYAQADDDPKNTGGWRVWVAIADVAAYVRPGSALDRGALRRGNSTYFPDRVAPMLPETLSADLCSLMEGQDRACLAVEMVFDKNGRKKSHRFARGLMRSAAKLSYGQAQAAIDGQADAKAAPLLDPILKPLWAAYACMKIGREARSPLEIDAPEHRIAFGKDGRVAGVTKRERFDAHKLIEEFMVMANVCAAETAEDKRTGLLYRVHDNPSEEKIAALMDFLPTVGMTWAKGQVVTSERFNRILEQAEKSEHKEIINEVVLRTQAQAVYAAENLGHFGLNLAKYAHFTSPIRRYSDLIVHRALVSALKLGKDGQSEEEAARLGEIGEHISMTERRSMAAERDATSRYIASFLADRVGASFTGKVSGVTRFGLFIRLEETQADGLAPISTLGRERWHHDEAAHALVGEESGRRYPLGMKIEVRLEEAAPVSGGLIFTVLAEPLPPAPGFKRARRSRQDEQFRRGARGGHKGGKRRRK